MVCRQRRYAKRVCDEARGSGVLVVEGERFEWSEGDFIELPAWMGHHHENPNQEDAFIAGWTDWPLQRLTGNFYYEEL